MEGLTAPEAKRRLNRFGPNEFDKHKGYSVLELWVSQFKSPLIYILVVAGLITAGLGEWVDSGVIWAAVVINTILGFWQEFKAARSLEALAAVLRAKATVIRDGQRQVIDAAEVVPGDVCVVRIGDTIPADGVWWDEDGVFCNEAILTGESVPMEKYDYPLRSRIDFEAAEERYKAWAGTTVVVGTGKILVVHTGRDTQMGKIAKALGKTREDKTPLQQRLAGLSRILALIVSGAAVSIVVIGLLRQHTLLEMFKTGVAVAVAAIPEGLVVALTVILALGMQRILKRKALVRRLLAAETLGSVSVICADKTGTLTEGKMRVTRVDWADSEAMGYQALVATNDQQNPVEVAMWEWLKERKIDGDKLAADFGRIDTVPFASAWKYKAALGRNLVFMLGAPDVVINKCQMQQAKLKIWLKKFKDYGSQGYRLVGMAYRHRRKGERKLTHEGVERKLNWLGLVIYEDPVRQSVTEALVAAQKAGIKVKVITGDYRETAVAVLRRLGIEVAGTEIMEGEELERISDQRLATRVEQIRLFARTDPNQKLRIVAALQQNGEVVAMTGDGVNDAPALKKADIGIVVSEASDVAKETADMVLLDSNFDTIVKAVEEGRVIYETMRKVIVYLLSDSFTELILVAGSLVLGLPLAIT
ncbi:MAG: cation-transporting P-type ATPase, partial [Candidatus Chisholmbacteria bacterium]|nr:cation-transporting P-type ATPase [Candidatus Chisholmbacteria bacterium]